jgi:hypothetical protein
MTNLIVPINVQALCVTDAAAGANLLGPSADFSLFPFWNAGAGTSAGEPYLGASIQAFPERGPGIGVHLHWSLPDALTHGAQDPASGVTTFPQVPNRWLITRIATRDGDPQPRFRSWVLESNQQVTDDAGQGSPSMPFNDPDSNQYFLYLGRAFDLDAWKESGCANPLTAVGNAAYGDVAFAAFYPNCRNVFGFFDDFAQTLATCDADGGHPESDQPLGDVHTLTYLVVGWYASPNQDPLVQSPIDGSHNALAWSFDGGVPTAMLCSGTVLDVVWYPARNDLAVQDSVLEVAVGNTAAEVLSALTADVLGPQDSDAEFLMNAVQQGLLTRLMGNDHPAAKLAYAMHKDQFSSIRAGSLWAVKPASSPGPDAAKTPPQLALPAPIAAAVIALDQAQAAYDAGMHELLSRQRQLFNDWYRYQLLAGATQYGAIATLAPDLQNNSDGLNDLIQAGLAAFNDRQAAVGLLNCTRDTTGVDAVSTASAPSSLAGAVVSAYQALASVLPAGAYRLHRLPAPCYWQPNDPVILLRGPDVAPSARYGAPSQPGVTTNLPCRLTGQTNSAISCPGTAALNTAAIAFNKGYGRLPPSVAADAQALLAEAIVWDTRFGDALVAALCATDAALVPATVAANLAVLRQALSATGTTTVAGLTVEGLPPAAIGRTVWAGTPWTPLYLHWSLEYLPVAGVPSATDAWAFDAGLVTNHHVLDADAVELMLKPDLVPTTGVTYEGIVPLGRGATVDLAGELARACQAYPDDTELADLAKQLSTVPCLSQAMSGLHQAMLMQYQTPQVDVFTAYADSNTAESVADIATAIGTARNRAPVRASANQSASDSDGFYAPIRTGGVALGTLLLYDAFGQVRKVQPVRTSWSRALRSDSGRLVLPPRVAQPARLQFRWLAAGGGDVELTDPSVASPVCGWVVPNFADESLALFDAGGLPLGELALIAAGSDIAWRPAPQADGPVLPSAVNKAAQIRATVTEPTLCAFALGVLAAGQDPQRGAGYLGGMIRTVDRTLTTVLPAAIPQNSSLALLMGRPLALTRARLVLDLMGLPSPDQGWPTLQAEADATQQPAAAARDQRGFTQVQFHVRLGDLAEAQDGLVGYFVEAGQAGNFLTFYSPGAIAGAPGVVSSSEQPLRLDFEAVPTTVAMLIDPYADVHATSGILPVQVISLPADQYAAALSNLSVYFYAGPLLVGTSGPDMPLPKLPGQMWSWRQASQGQWQTTPWAGAADDRVRWGYSPLKLVEGFTILTETPPSP